MSSHKSPRNIILFGFDTTKNYRYNAAAMMYMNNDEPSDDIEFTDTDNTIESELEEVEENSKDKIKKLQAKLRACEAEKRDHLEELQRTKAEFLNARKRLEEQKNIEVERAADAFVLKLLPLCDSFAMAMGDNAVWESVDENWRKGVEAVYAQLQSILKAYHVEAINPEGEEFDPDKHEALGTQDSDSDSDTVIQVIQQGYSRNGEIIRPAKVIISN